MNFAVAPLAFLFSSFHFHFMNFVTVKCVTVKCVTARMVLVKGRSLWYRCIYVRRAI